MKTTKTSILLGFASLALAATSFAQPNISDLADVDGNLNAAVTTLDKNTAWVLDKKIYVPEGKILNIQAGTVIKASVGTGLAAPALIVTRGAKIYALGTAEEPIIFTSVEDPLDGSYSLGVRNQGKWGGVLLMGRAYNNLRENNEFGVAEGEGTIEGLEIPDDRHHYGQDRYETQDEPLPAGVSLGDLKPGGDFNNEDNSGIMRYVSIRHGGAVVGTANEINGLTCGSVGRGTTLEHIEVIANQDDGIEFFGGNVDLKYATVLFCNDDYLDWDLGYSGRCQFIYGLQLPASANPDTLLREGDNGLEIDGDDDNSFLTDPLPAGVSMGNAQVYNVTIIGNAGDEGIEAKERVEATINNSIFANFSAGVHLNRETPARAIDGYENWLADKLVLKNNTFAGNGMTLKVKGVKASDTDSTNFAADGNIVNNSVIDYSLSMNGVTNVVTGTVNPVPANLADVATDLLPPYDDFFTPVNYRGAFAPGETPWTSGWTIGDDVPLDKGILGCPSDINGDGTTSTEDFLELAGAWGPCSL